MKNSQNSDLHNLVFPMSSDDFLQRHWPEVPLFIPQVQGKLEQIFNLPQLQSLQNLIATRTQKVRACLPDFDDEYSSIHVEPKDALKVYENNMTLVFDSMQLQIPLINDVLKKLTAELGLQIGDVDNNLCQARSIAYATPAWCGTRLHFDANANFIIQISGTKKWTLVKNKSVDHPTERFTAGSFEMPQALEKQCHAELLDSVPSDCAENYTMEPGCVLFVPRGYWHETTTDEDSLSLNFTFSQPTWAEVFSKSIYNVLIQSPSWRQLCQGLGHNASQTQKASAYAQMDLLIKELTQRLLSIPAAELLTEGGFVADDSTLALER